MTTGSRNRRHHGLIRASLRSVECDFRFSCALLRYTLLVSLERAWARRCRRTGEYVSGIIRLPVIQSTPDMIAMNPSIHLQLWVCSMKLPMIGPSVGPKNRLAVKILIAGPRSFREKISASTPPVLTSDEDPNAPPKNRHTRSDSMFLEHAAPTLKAVNAAKVVMNIICRPIISHKEAHTSGPTAKQTTKSETPR